MHAVGGIKDGLQFAGIIEFSTTQNGVSGDMLNRPHLAGASTSAPPSSSVAVAQAVIASA